MTKEKDTVTEATEELTESLREANRVIADSLVAAQERNWKFAQSVMEHELDLFKSHTESTRALMEKLMGSLIKGLPCSSQWQKALLQLKRRMYSLYRASLRMEPRYLGAM